MKARFSDPDPFFAVRSKQRKAPTRHTVIVTMDEVPVNPGEFQLYTQITECGGVDPHYTYARNNMSK